MVFAQLAADPIHVWNFLVIIGFLASTGASLAAILGQRRTQRREVSILDNFVTMQFCERQHGRLSSESDANRVEKRQDIINLREEKRQDSGLLHTKIESVALSVAEINGQLGLINQRLTQVDFKLDRSIERGIKKSLP